MKLLKPNFHILINKNLSPEDRRKEYLKLYRKKYYKLNREWFREYFKEYVKL